MGGRYSTSNLVNGRKSSALPLLILHPVDTGYTRFSASPAPRVPGQERFRLSPGFPRFAPVRRESNSSRARNISRSGAAGQHTLMRLARARQAEKFALASGARGRGKCLANIRRPTFARDRESSSSELSAPGMYCETITALFLCAPRLLFSSGSSSSPPRSPHSRRRVIYANDAD